MILHSVLIRCQDAIDLIEPLIHMLEGFPITNVIDQDNAILGVATDWIKPNMGTLTQQVFKQNSAAYSATVVPFSAACLDPHSCSCCQGS